MSDTFGAYCAGFFDGEGWVYIGRERKEGRADVHRISVYITQRARYREVLDRIQTTYGCTVSVRDTKLKGRENWAEQADWHIHTRPAIEHFCLAVQPYCIVKARQIAIALEYVRGFIVSANVRDDLGRLHGRSLTIAEAERRERLRLDLQEANAKGPLRTVKIGRPPVVARSSTPHKEAVRGNTTTVSRGEGRYNSVLTEATVRAMRAEYAAGGITMGALALRYGVTPTAIRLAIRGLSWQHVADLPDGPPPGPPAPSPAIDQLGLFGPDA